MNDNNDLVAHLKCDVELNLSGPVMALVNKTAADLLRSLADRVEKGELDDGFHPVNDKSGNPVGEIYVDYSEGTA